MEKRQTLGRRSNPVLIFLATLSCASIVLAVAACAGDRPGGRARSSAGESAGGYLPGEHEAVNTSEHLWPIAGRIVKVLLSEPASPRLLPVVIYVPGLGESSGAGDRWRGAWSSAGYAVMSVQPLTEDEMAWTSELARTGEFKALAQERYSALATSRRVRALEAIAGEARRRSLAGEAGWQRIDWDRVAIAGFDLGAYTAIALAGDREQDAEATPERIRFRAALALSPYASVSAPGRGARDRVGHIPVLAVTSDADGDPLGVVAAGDRSDRAYDRIEGPDTYLLLMTGLTHASLSGSAAAEKAAESHTSARLPAADSSAGGDSNGRPARGRHGSAGTPGGSARNLAAGAGSDADVGLSAADTRIRMGQAEQVSTAFLDAYLKGDAHAREWLAAPVSSWLGATGELRRRRAAGESG